MTNLEQSLLVCCVQQIWENLNLFKVETTDILNNLIVYVVWGRLRTETKAGYLARTRPLLLTHHRTQKSMNEFKTNAAGQNSAFHKSFLQSIISRREPCIWHLILCPVQVPAGLWFSTSLLPMWDTLSGCDTRNQDLWQSYEILSEVGPCCDALWRLT